MAPRIGINGVEGWGKTTLAAFAPKPAILMSRGETGFVTLRSKQLVPDADCLEVSTWADALAAVESIVNTDHETLVLDALGGFERLCHEFVCKRDFGGEWGGPSDKGFLSYGKGPDISIAEWLKMLAALDRVRSSRGVAIILLSHAKIKPFKNPLGVDFDRYVADCHEKTWSVTHKWLDASFFANFETITAGGEVGDRPKKGKGLGGDERKIYTVRRDAYDAKNRYGMDAELVMPPDATRMWSTLWEAMTKETQK